MSRNGNTRPLTLLEQAIYNAIKDYHSTHKTLTADRQNDINAIRAILSNTNFVDAQKHVRIANYIKKDMVFGLFGRSELRGNILKALESVPLLGLIDELVRCHKAKINLQEAQINALQIPRHAGGGDYLLLQSKIEQLQSLQEKYDELKQKAKIISDLYEQLTHKYKALKKSYAELCRQHNVSRPLVSEVISPPSLGINDRLLEEDAQGEASASYGSRDPRLFGYQSARHFTKAQAESEADDTRDYLAQMDKQ